MALEPKLSYSNSRERHALDVFFLKTVLETLAFLLFPMLGKQHTQLNLPMEFQELRLGNVNLKPQFEWFHMGFTLVNHMGFIWFFI